MELPVIGQKEKIYIPLPFQAHPELKAFLCVSLGTEYLKKKKDNPKSGK